jgi:hypothetical protein
MSKPNQCASAVVMIRPAAFDYNPETAQTNKMQTPDPELSSTAAARALDEFDGFVNALRSEGVAVEVFADTPVPPKPDALFPNNWVSFHADGTVVLYPMQAENRRRERNPAVVELVVRNLGGRISRTVDLTHWEKDGRFLEGTGSLVLDHIARVAYACVSSRTDAGVVEEWCGEMGYESCIFTASDRSGIPLYHTNVMLCIGERVVIVGSESIVAGDRGRVLERLRASGREIVEIGHEAVAGFAGNMLELASWDEALGDFRVLVMSAAARHVLSDDQFARISACTDTVLAVPVPTIERLGGGSVRCMLAEVFLPT